MKKTCIRLVVFPIIILSVSLACRIGGLELHFDEANQAWIEPVTGLDFSQIVSGPESIGVTPGDAVKTIATTGEICEVHAQTPFCKAVLSGDEEAIGRLDMNEELLNTLGSI